MAEPVSALTVHHLRTGRVVAICWLVVAALSIVDILRRGSGGTYLGAILALLASCLVAYVFGLRPAVAEDLDAVEVRNPVRTTRISWASITSIDSVDVLRIHTAGTVTRCFAIPSRMRPVRPAGTITGGITGGLNSHMRLPGLPPLSEDSSRRGTRAGAGAVGRRLTEMAPALAAGHQPEPATTHVAPDAVVALGLALVLLVAAVL